MAELSIHQEDLTIESHLVIKPIVQMSMPELKAWYLAYMRTVDDENIMMVSGLPIEVDEDSNKFHAFVEREQAEMVERGEI